jgi:hypothetical protein
MLRRLSAVAVVGAVALVALAGCRIESPADAAYVGNTRHSQVDVDKIVDRLKADGAAFEDSQKTAVRQRVVGDLVFLDVAKRYATEKGYPAPPVNTDALASAYQLPATDDFVKLEAQALAYQTMLTQKVAPATVTPADYHEAYELLLQQEAVQPGSEPAVTQQLQQQFGGQLGAVLGLRHELTGAMKRYGTSVNPRLLPVGYTLLTVPTQSGGQLVLVRLPLGGSGTAAPVRDLPATAAPTLAPESTQ